MKRSIWSLLLAGAVAAAATALSAQLAIPEIQYDSNPDLLKFPTGVYMGEAAGVATNSKGDIFLYTRTGNPVMTLGTSRALTHGGSRLFQFDKAGTFVREIGQGAYGLLQAQQVRVDAQDNIWIVDQLSMMVIKFDPNGRVLMMFSRKPEAVRVPSQALDPAPAGLPVILAVEPPAGRGAPPPAAPPPAGRGLPGAGAAGESFNRPSDVAWDSAGNIYVADGFGNARIAKYDSSGKYIKSWGSRGTAQGEFNVIHGIAIDGQQNVYVADEGNRRIQVFDSDGTFKKQFLNVGTPTALCITPGPRQYLYVAHTGDKDGMEDASIVKVDLDGRIVGKFGNAGKQPKELGLVNAIDCRVENELLIGELSNWRVQKLTLKAAAR